MSKILVIFLVACAAYYLIRRALVGSGSAGCSKGCGCGPGNGDKKDGPAQKKPDIEAEFKSKF